MSDSGFKQFLWSVWEVIEVVLVAVFTVFIIRTFLVQPFLVSGASMEPNFSNGNYLLIDEITYRLREPHRGEVIIFRYPNDRSTFFIKRIIGLPGETVLVSEGQIRVNGTSIHEQYLPPDIKTIGKVNLKLGPDEFFVLGDNRYYSFDSRNWGPVNRKDIIGLARVRLLPVNQISTFEAPVY